MQASIFRLLLPLDKVNLRSPGRIAAAVTCAVRSGSVVDDSPATIICSAVPDAGAIRSTDCGNSTRLSLVLERPRRYLEEPRVVDHLGDGVAASEVADVVEDLQVVDLAILRGGPDAGLHRHPPVRALVGGDDRDAVPGRAGHAPAAPARTNGAEG